MMDISRQAYVYLIIFLITSVINGVLTLNIYGMYGPLIYLGVVFVALPFVILYMYHIDCLTTGKCNTWSWIYTIFACLSLIITTLMSALIVLFREDIEKKIENANNNKKIIPNPYNLM